MMMRLGFEFGAVQGQNASRIAVYQHDHYPALVFAFSLLAKVDVGCFDLSGEYGKYVNYYPSSNGVVLSAHGKGDSQGCGYDNAPATSTIEVALCNCSFDCG